MEKCLQTIAALICGILSYMYGEFDGMMKILIFCIVCDYITGLASAYKNKELSSRIGFLGIMKKVTILLIVALCHITDMELFGESAFMKSAVCGFYIANESLSILENTAAMGVKYPQKLLETLKQFNKGE